MRQVVDEQLVYVLRQKITTVEEVITDKDVTLVSNKICHQEEGMIVDNKEIDDDQIQDIGLNLQVEYVQPLVTKKNIINSLKWTAIEKYASQGIQFIVSIVMARILTPAEYGIVGIIGIFIGVAQIFINSGLTQALVSKKNCSVEDYSTANWINIGISVGCYILLFFTAPIIASFYDTPILIPTIRVMSLTFIIGALSGVGRTILTKEMKFKKLSFITLSCSIVSGIVGISMAYMGMGVWALVYQTVLASIITTIVTVYISHFKFRFCFKRKSFNGLFSYGAKILASDIVWSIFSNINPLLIGKAFNTQILGYYTRAYSYSTLVPSNFESVLSKVLFPSFAIIQDDRHRTQQLYKRAVSITSCVIFAGNFLLIGLAYPLVNIMLTEKWLPCVPILQILCLSTVFGQIRSINSQVFLTQGFPGINLKLIVFTQPLHLIILLLSIQFGIMAVAWGEVIYSFIYLVASCYMLRKHIGISINLMLRPIMPIFLYSGAIGFLSMISFHLWLSPSFINLLIIGLVDLALIFISIRYLSPKIYFELKNIHKG